MAVSDLITSINTGITNIANAIRSKTGSQSSIPFANLPSAINDVYTAGQNEMWDALQNYGTRTNYEYGFSRWKCEYIRPKYKVFSNNRSIYLFSHNYYLKKVEKQYFDLSEGSVSDTNSTGGHYYTFYNCSSLEEIEDIGMKAGYYNYTFNGCSSLHTIEVIRFNETTLVTSPFVGCTELQNITVSGTIGQIVNFSYCTKLSKASITSVINHLSNNASGKSITFSQTAVQNAFTTQEWNALIGTKSNWTISLS